MSDDRNVGIGGLFKDDCAILFFIILFLLLFIKPTKFGVY